MNTPRNPILIGQAEVIDLLLPEVRTMLQRQGIYLASDSARPGFTVPLVVNADGVWSMQIDGRLDPERFHETVRIAGPFYAPGEVISAAGVACTCPSGDGSLRHPCQAHANECTPQPVAAPDIDHAGAALAHLSNALDDLQYSPDQRPVPLIREAMWHVQQMQASIDASPKGGSDAHDAARLDWLAQHGASLRKDPNDSLWYLVSPYHMGNAIVDDHKRAVSPRAAVDAAMQAASAEVGA